MDATQLAPKTSAALSAASTLQGGSGATTAVKDSQGAMFNAQRVRMGTQELSNVRGAWTR